MSRNENTHRRELARALGLPPDTPARVLAIEAALWHVQGRWIERLLLEAPSEAEALRLYRKVGRGWGWYASGLRLDGWRDGFEYQIDGERGQVSIREIVWYARRPRQLALLE